MNHATQGPPQALISNFRDHLTRQGCAPTTVDGYVNDISAFWYPRLQEQHTTLLKATRSHFRTCIETDAREHMPTASLARRLSSAGRFYEFLVKQGAVKINPIEGIDRPRASRVRMQDALLTPDELADVINVRTGIAGLRDRNRLILRCMAETGIKSTTLARLTTAAHDLDTLARPKVRIGERWVPITCPALSDELRVYVGGTREELVGASPTNLLFPKSYSPEPMTRANLWHIVKVAGQAAGLNREITAIILHRSHLFHLGLILN